MTRTTPPRQIDVASLFPALASLARTATRLHPRPGSPSPQDSSVGGPLLWPAAEPWPHCGGPHEQGETFVRGRRTPAPATSRDDVLLQRRITAAAASRSPNPYFPDYTPEEKATLDRIDTGRPWPEGPVPMLPVAQLYARDVPGLPTPAGTDLLQVLWCPFDHPPTEYMPKTALFWRSADAVTDIRTDPPEPADVQYEGYVPEPCTISPEQITEYPSHLELSKDLRASLEDWGARQSTGADPDSDDDPGPEFYERDLSVAPGWKVGGWIGWGLTDPYPQPCPVCGTPTEPLLTIATAEWDSATGSWVPDEDRAAGRLDIGYPHGPGYPTKILIARGYNEIVRVCPASPDHLHVHLMQ